MRRRSRRVPARSVVVHIGTAKTGSTAVQSALFRHRDELLRHGIAYLPGEGHINNRDLAAACVADEGDDDLLDELGLATPSARAAFGERVIDRLRRDVAALPADVHTVVISSEHFHSRLVGPSMVRRLGDALAPWAGPVRIVCYLRRQVDLLVSFYSTYLRNGGCETLDEVGDRVLRTGHPYADYDHLLSMWADVFGDDALEPRCFGELVGGSVVNDVGAAVGAPRGLLTEGRPENTSISRFGQALLRAINRAIADGAAPEPLITARTAIADAFPGPGERWPPSVAAARQAPFEIGNEVVRRRWFPDRTSLFSPDHPPVPPMDVTTDQQDALAAVFARLVAPADR